MAKLSAEDVLQLARLARLSLSKNELEMFTQELSQILDYVQQLSSIDLSDYEPTVHVNELSHVVRKDEVTEYQASPDGLLKNVPLKEGRYIKVKRILD